MSRTILTVVAAPVLMLGLLACGVAGPDDGAPSAPTRLTVFAAASLTVPFTELADRFEHDHVNTEVMLNFGGSADLVAQIQQGAPADVFASADQPTMAKAGDLVVDPVDFATNVLQIVTPAQNPASVVGLADLARPDVTVVICAPQVPCGAATLKVAEAAGITITAVSEESSVTDVLGKVRADAADAGLVYTTDVIAAGDAVTGIDFAESAAAVNTYPIARMAASRQGNLAAEFVRFVTGPRGQEILAAAGFGAP